MKHPMVLLIGFAVICQGCEETPIEYGPKPGPEWDHCPSAESYVGDTSWKRELIVTNAAEFCEYPAQSQPLEQALTLNKRLRVVAGTYPLPAEGEELPFSLPVCLLDGTGPLPGVAEGSVQAGENDFGGGVEWWVNAELPRSEGAGKVIVSLRSGAEEESVTVDGTGLYGWGLNFSLCDTDACAFERLSHFATCHLEPTTCDRFTFADGDELALDQYHWVGQVGAGFAAITEARGSYAGTPFTVSQQSQLVMSYGHHAFTRSAILFFDEPIGEACGLWIDEVTASEYSDGIWTVDCDGNPITELSVVEEVHEYQQGACPQ